MSNAVYVVVIGMYDRFGNQDLIMPISTFFFKSFENAVAFRNQAMENEGLKDMMESKGVQNLISKFAETNHMIIDLKIDIFDADDAEKALETLYLDK